MFVTVISSTRISILGIDLADSIFVFIIRTLYFLENLSFSIYNGNIFITSELESEYLSNISKTEISHSIDGISKRDRPHLSHSTKSKRDRPHLNHSTKSKRDRPHLSHSTKSKRDKPHLSHSTKSKRGIPHVGHSGTPRYCDMKSNKKTNDTFENYHHETLPSLPDTDHHSRVNCGNCDIALYFHSSIHVCLATNETIKEFFNDGNKNDESNEMERDLQQCTDHDYNGMTWQLLSKELTKCRSTLSKSPSRKLANEMEILQRGQSNQGSWGIEIQTRKIGSAVLVEAVKKRRKSVAFKHLGNNDHTVRVRNKNMAVTDVGGGVLLAFKIIISLTRPRRPIISLKRCDLFDDGCNCGEITCPQCSVDGKRFSHSCYGNSTFTGVDDINVTAIDELGVCPLWYNNYSCSTSEVTSYSVWPENCNRNENSTCHVRDDDLEGNHRDDSKFIYAHHPGNDSKHASDDNDYIHNTQFARADYSGDCDVNSVLNACLGVDAEHFTSCFDAELISDNMFAANDVSYSNIIPQNVSDSNIIPNNENKDIVVSKNQNVSDSNIIPNNENKDIVVSKNQSEDVVHEETGNGDVNATHTAQHTNDNIDITNQHTSDNIDNTCQHTSDNTDNTVQHTSDDFNNTAQHTNDNIDITNQHTNDNIDNTCQHTSHNTDITYQHTSDNVDNIDQHTSDNIDETNHTNVDTIVSEYSSNDDNDNDEHLNKKNNGEKNIKLPGKISSSEISPSLKRKFIMIDTECAENLRKTFPANPVLYDLQRNMANSVSQITSSNIKQMISLQTEKKLKDQKMQDPDTNLPSEMSTPYYSMYSFTPCSRDVLLTVNMLKAPQAQSPMMKTDVVHAGLESELRRLATFYSFQPPQGVFVIRLANNGFFYPAGDKSDVVECAFCLVTVPASKFSGRLVSEVHKEISPNCSFLLGTDTRNVSIATLSQNSGNQFVHQYGSNLYQGASSLLPADSGPGNSQHHNGSSSVHSFQRAAVDLAIDGEPLTLPTTVKGFDEPSFQADLSAAGSGSAERTVPDSRPSLQQPLTDLNSRPNTTHRPAPTVSAYQTASYRPEATPYTMTPNNTESQEHTNTNNNTTGKVDGDGRRVVTYEQLGIYAQRPKRQDMAVTAVRINTFSTGWPHSEIQPPAKMATAGFFYTGRSDLVRCFHCKGGLKTWDASDDPWVEHGRWFSTCPFVRLNKGEKFVEAIKSLVTPDNQKITLAAVEQKVNEMEDAEKRQRAMVTFPSVLEGNQQGSATTGDQLNGLNFASLKNGTFLDDEDTLREISQRLEEENQEMKSYTLCKICQTEKVNVLLLPCGHLIACAQCAPALRNCAICRQPVKGTVRVQLDEEKT